MTLLFLDIIFVIWYQVPHELDFGRLESLWTELTSESNNHAAFLQSELERLRRLEAICQEIDLQTVTVEEALSQAEMWLEKLASDDLSDVPLDVDPVEECIKYLNQAEDINKDLFQLVEELKTGKYYRADEYYQRVFELHERWVEDQNEFNRLKRLGLLDPLSIKERRKLRPPLKDSMEWSELMTAEQYLEESRQTLINISAGENGETAHERRTEISNLAYEFESWYSSITVKLDGFYANFDEGSKDYKGYHDRYTKFKMDCELHRGALKRREQEQDRCIDFVEACERHSAELMAIVNKIQSDDWGNEAKDVNEAERDFEVLKYFLISCTLGLNIAYRRVEIQRAK